MSKDVIGYKKVEGILAMFLFAIPAILIVVSGELRPSISDYAYSQQERLLVLLLTLAGSLFIYNGSFNRDKWYNIVLGLSLLGLAMTPHLDYPFWHYFFALIFFVGNMVVIPVYSSAKERFIKIIIAVGILLSLLAYFLGFTTLLLSEWIALLLIGMHFMAESLGYLD